MSTDAAAQDAESAVEDVAADPAQTKPPERRTLRWLLGGQIVLAVLLIGVDFAPMLPTLFNGTNAPELTQPVNPGDQRRRYDPSQPSTPNTGGDPNMPRRLTATSVAEGDQTGLLLRGVINAGDGPRISAELSTATPAFVTFDSPGGSVGDALEIGRKLRDLKVGTKVGADAICLSACPYMFVGGTDRSVDGAGRLGVHQHSFGESTILPAFLATESIQRGQAQVLDHLVTMGIDLKIMGPAMATPADEIYILTAEELAEWDVVTGE